MLGALYDAIGRLEFSIEWEAKIPHRLVTVEHCFGDLSVAELKELLDDPSYTSKDITSDDDHCSYCGERTDKLVLTRSTTQQEQNDKMSQCMNYRKAAINFINGCIERHPDQKKSCMEIINRKGLKEYLLSGQ